MAHGGRHWGDVSGSQGMPAAQLEEGKEQILPESQREHSPADSLILDFWPPEL